MTEYGLIQSLGLSRWRLRARKRTGSLVLCPTRTSEVTPVAQTNAACPDCWAPWRASWRLGAKKATRRRESWRWCWRMLSCGGSFSTSPTRWSSPRTDGGCNFLQRSSPILSRTEVRDQFTHWDVKIHRKRSLVVSHLGLIKQVSFSSLKTRSTNPALVFISSSKNKILLKFTKNPSIPSHGTN